MTQNDTYKMNAKCGNCFSRVEVQIPKGTTVDNYESIGKCGYCGVEGQLKVERVDAFDEFFKKGYPDGTKPWRKEYPHLDRLPYPHVLDPTDPHPDTFTNDVNTREDLKNLQSYMYTPFIMEKVFLS